MSEHPAVAHLLAAHERAEKLARATTVHQPYDEWDALGIDGDGDVARSIWEVPMIARRWANTPAARSIMEHIALHDPAAVLRRIAADREQLAEHEATWSSGEPEYGHHHETAISQTTGRTIYVEVRDTEPTPSYWCATCQAMAPCRTVLLLAKSWGWESAS